MPELPEVETTARGLNQKVLNRAFLGLWTDAEKLFKKPKSLNDFKKGIKGRRIVRVWRKAKNVIFELSEGYSLLIHQKMTGHLLVGKWVLKDNIWKPVDKGPLNDPYNRFIHIIFFFDNGSMMALSDLRKFAKVELWRTKELLNSKEFSSLGPEPLEKSFTFEKFKDVLKNKRGKIKAILMKPEIIAGIGNIYSDEALWRAKINPLKDVSKLKNSELKNLYTSIIKVLKKGVELGGESFSDYRKPDGTKGDFDDERKAYKRAGERCLRCKKAIIKRIKINGRSACFCPKCQP
ncbi:MAG: DNA-formamidopyrimidine glycosylase [Candidatus Nealsonbacteria bacterium]|nr:DNA-formamidopyrimidine glycosylase [Candidatus Nealsonbacteria bacterium]